MSFDDAFNFTMRYEVGQWFDPTDRDVILLRHSTPAQKKKVGYVNDPDDGGGETILGLSSKANPQINFDTIVLSEAKTIYQMKYWRVGKCDKLPTAIAFAHFDACVNHGPKKAIQLLQRAVGVVDDGDLGPATLKAVTSKPVKEVLVGMLNERRKFFNDIVKKNPTQQKFLRGWLNRVDDVEKRLA